VLALAGPFIITRVPIVSQDACAGIGLQGKYNVVPVINNLNVSVDPAFSSKGFAAPARFLNVHSNHPLPLIEGEESRFLSGELIPKIQIP
jgi:hypothetical protein